jgi:hypothetical protein
MSKPTPTPTTSAITAETIKANVPENIAQLRNADPPKSCIARHRTTPSSKRLKAATA